MEPFASIAQLVEHHHGKVGVSGSSPLGSLVLNAYPIKGRAFFCVYKALY